VSYPQLEVRETRPRIRSPRRTIADRCTRMKWHRSIRVASGPSDSSGDDSSRPHAGTQ